MARKPTTKPQPEPARLSSEQMRRAIPRLQRRVEELSALNLNALTEENGDNTLKDQENKINATVMDIYGHSTIEFQRYSVEDLSSYPMIYTSDTDTSYRARLQYVRPAVASALSNLKSAIEILKESTTEDVLSGPGAVIRAYQGLELHTEIARASSQLYQDSHYSNAVEAAVKALNGLVRLRSGLDVDGTTLMEQAFSPNNPKLKFNALADQSDKDEQKGFMMMFSGAVSGLRNPRAHGFVQDDPERALEFIAFVSLLAKLLDGAKP